eukprot:5661319-Pyramimonas_sp.AAC.1
MKKFRIADSKAEPFAQRLRQWQRFARVPEDGAQPLTILWRVGGLGRGARHPRGRGGRLNRQPAGAPGRARCAGTLLLTWRRGPLGCQRSERRRHPSHRRC